MTSPIIVSVHKSSTHTFEKYEEAFIDLEEGFGVVGDAHYGRTVKHRSRITLFGDQPNLRQVHLIHQELFEELGEQGFVVKPGQMGENLTTSGIDLLGLPTNTVLSIGENTKIQVTGLRNPCRQLNGIKEGLMKALVFKDDNKKVVRKAGIMAIVLKSGPVKPGDHIIVQYPKPPFKPLEKV